VFILFRRGQIKSGQSGKKIRTLGDPNVNQEEGQPPFSHRMTVGGGGGTGVQIKKPGAHSPLINNKASIVHWPVILQTIVLCLLYFYEFINSSH
jgi:hypothetical protein